MCSRCKGKKVSLIDFYFQERRMDFEEKKNREANRDFVEPQREYICKQCGLKYYLLDTRISRKLHLWLPIPYWFVGLGVAYLARQFLVDLLAGFILLPRMALYWMIIFIYALVAGLSYYYFKWLCMKVQ